MCERTHESAACADSCITSPSWPVIVSAPLPGYAVASMKRTSPPTAVYASPVATPGSDVRLRTSPEKRRGAEPVAQQLVVDLDLRRACPVATCVAALRQTSAMRRSRLRTPASRVYSRMIVRSTLSESVSCARSQAVRRRAASGRGSASRSRASRPRCSRRAGSRPCGRAAAPGIVSSVFAVQMKSIFERSNGRSR